MIHALAGLKVPGQLLVSQSMQDEIWSEIPYLLVPLQDRLRQFAAALDGAGEVVADLRVNRTLEQYQRICGDHYWAALEREDPRWLESHYDQLHRDLALDELW